MRATMVQKENLRGLFNDLIEAWGKRETSYKDRYEVLSKLERFQ